jgi:hypothetical protein
MTRVLAVAPRPSRAEAPLDQQGPNSSGWETVSVVLVRSQQTGAKLTEETG